jgi:hypothetical protein
MIVADSPPAHAVKSPATTRGPLRYASVLPTKAEGGGPRRGRQRDRLEHPRVDEELGSFPMGSAAPPASSVDSAHPPPRARCAPGTRMAPETSATPRRAR